MKRIPYLHIVLFIATFLSTLTVGALQNGVNVLTEPLRIYEGFPFSFTLMSILLSHELAHYFAAIKHNTKASLPYFIPAPTMIGTFGAFIKMKSPIQTRKALIDIGASGPIAGFVVSVIASIVGLSYSTIVPFAESKGALVLGDSILFSLFSRLILDVPGPSFEVMLHPIAFAGWIGLFVTSLNLIPAGQLDGGHVAYAFLGEKQVALSRMLVPVLFILGLFTWEGWMLWAGLLFLLGLKHPQVTYWELPLDNRRRLTGVAALVIFILTFIPWPFRML